MSKGSKRTRIIIPEDILRQVDALVGPGHRSEFFVDAACEKVRREQLRRTTCELAGALQDEPIPGWETPEASSAWVRSLRKVSDERAFSSGRRE